MEEPFGFLPRAAYFGGCTPNQVGHSNMFVRAPWRSPFPPVPGRARLLAATQGQALRARVLAEAAARVPDFAARYVDGFAIPDDALASYALAEVQPPWGPCCGYRSLFHILDDAGLRWVQCAWPYTRAVSGGDNSILATCLDQLTDETRFAFVHLSDLDAVGHAAGPGSAALQATLGEIDASCEHLFHEVHARFDHVQILFFGDHGMVPVVRRVNLLHELATSGLDVGRDFEVFVDSPMARFWFTSDAARAALHHWLDQQACGRTLTVADLARFDADRMHPAAGELFFVAHPGIVFAPNAFQDATVQVRGMHGYLPDVPDNRGLLLLYDSADRTAGSLGVAQATQIFPTVLHMCGIDPAAHTAIARLRVIPGAEGWTRDRSPGHEARARHDVRTAAATLASRAPASAVVVTGSFGRGEGGVVDGPTGAVALNDYDFVVAGCDAAAAAGLGPALATTLGTDFCDVMPMAAVNGLPATQLHFDLRYGSRVVAGDRRVLDRLPAYAPADIPPDDAALLLLNRSAGVMLVPVAEQRGATGPLSQSAVNQLTKALVAIGDAYLIGIGDYSSRIAERAARFAALAHALDIDPGWRGRIGAAYAYKIAPLVAPAGFGADDFATLRHAVPVALRALLPSTAQSGPAAGAAAWPMAIEAALSRVPDLELDDAMVRERLRTCGWHPPAPPVVGGLRRAILAGVAALFLASGATEDAGAWEATRQCLTQLGMPPAGAPDCQAMELARVNLAGAWLSTCH